MEIKINGKNVSVDNVYNMSDLIKSKDLSVDRIVVEYNYVIVPKEKWETTTISHGDNIEIVSFVGGG